METLLDREFREDTTPWVVFRVKNTYYCVDSKDISTILLLPEHQPLPAAPGYITGIFLYRGEVIQMLDLRTVFGLPTQEKESEEFSQMLEARKQDHIRWVNALEQSIANNQPFTLPTDPHQCAFGRWYDSYKPDNEAVRSLLAQIDTPHRRLHEAAIEAENCKKESDLSKREACLREVLRKAKEQYMPRILELLDEAKRVFSDLVYREMALILNDGSRVALVADEVISVETLEPIDNSLGEGLGDTRYIASVRQSAKVSSVILQLDLQKLMATLAYDAQ